MDDRVISALKDFATEKKADLEAERQACIEVGNHPDWPWNGLIISFATLGGSWRWEKRVKPKYNTHYSWDSIAMLNPEDREDRLKEVGRFPNRIANFLEVAFGRITESGGPARFRESLKNIPISRILPYWKSFPGIGEKYSRNIMMTAYCPGFIENYFAIDSRIQKLLPLLGYVGSGDYEEQELFLCDLANRTKLTGWEMDRVLYMNVDVIEERLVATRT